MIILAFDFGSASSASAFANDQVSPRVIHSALRGAPTCSSSTEAASMRPIVSLVNSIYSGGLFKTYHLS